LARVYFSPHTKDSGILEDDGQNLKPAFAISWTSQRPAKPKTFSSSKKKTKNFKAHRFADLKWLP